MRKLKRLLITLLALYNTCSQAAICEDFAHGRFYLGPSLLVEQTSASNSSFRGMHPRLSLGYMDISNKYFMAAELFVIPFTMNFSNMINPNGRSAKDSSSMGFSILPGAYLYHDFYGYARVGVVTTQWSSPKSSQTGIQMGLGLQRALSAQWLIRGEYLFTSYNAVSGLGNPSTNELGVGLIYLI